MSVSAGQPVGQAVEARATRVLICDDSLVIRGAIGRMLRGEADIEVSASVRDGRAAVEAVQARLNGLSIDVVVLDIEMPVMDGMTALPLLLAADPTVRVIMASTLTTRGATIAVEALALGAADYVPKPSTAGQGGGDEEFKAELIAKVRGYGRLRRRQCDASASRGPRLVDALPRSAAIPARPAAVALRPAVLAVGSSTGGPQALLSFFRRLGPSLGIPVILTQHMPAAFVPLLAEQITKAGGMACREAVEGERLVVDRVAIAPGGRHLTIRGGPEAMEVALSDAAAENHCRPSVDVMLRSAAATCPGRVLVVMLTGMGRDGLLGTQRVVEGGGCALAQDEASSVVWGMPGAIATAGLCRSVLPLDKLPDAVRDLVKR